ncbi:MAG: thioredoxin fold domain-containing protein [Bradyrhizobium sp.]
MRGADGPQIFYADESASVLIAGRMFEVKSERGNGRRKIAILSDPNCPYCKHLEEDLQKLDDITAHILPYAVINPESVRQAKSAWCSRDRVKSGNELMFRRVEPLDAASPPKR